MSEQSEEELGYEMQSLNHEAQREQMLSELQEGNRNLHKRIKELEKLAREAIGGPVDEFELLLAAERSGRSQIIQLERRIKELEADRLVEVRCSIDAEGKPNTKYTYCYACGTGVRNQKYCHTCGRKLNWQALKG